MASLRKRYYQAFQNCDNMKQKRYCLAFVFTVAILLSSLLTSLANCDEPLVEATVALGPEYFYQSEYWWIRNVTGGSTISIDISVQSGHSVDFYIERGTNGERVFEKNDFQTLQDNWVVPDTGDYSCNLDNSEYGSTTSQVRILIQKIEAQGGGFDPLPVVIVAIVVVIALLAALLIIRTRKQPPLPPLPATGELPPPPP